MNIPADFERVIHRLGADVKKGDETLARQDMLTIRVRLRDEGASDDTIALLRCELSSTLKTIREVEAANAASVDTQERSAA